ncbi:MAG: BMP family protein [Anaerolineales bacterium]|nr:BMP family protein [Anaerolineales bacterium]
MSRRSTLIVLMTVASLLLVSCGAAATPSPAAEEELRLAAIFPGVVTDADYNTLGYIGATEVESEMGIDMAYSESVAVPDVERVMREYIDNDFNVIFTHGGQFFSQTQTLAEQNPDRYFIAEFDAPAEDAPDNFWVIDRNFHIGFYALGVLAGHLTETGRIGYLGGLTLPFSYAEVHAIEQALADEGLDGEVEVQPVWVGDFNDPTGARELADAMISDDVDVIIGSLNLGMLGVFEAAKSAEQTVYVTAKYTDKSNFAPDQYVTSVLYDWAGPLTDIITNIQEGETGGYYPLGFDTGVSLQEPQNVPDDVTQRVNEVVEQLRAGEIEVEKNTEPIE